MTCQIQTEVKTVGRFDDSAADLAERSTERMSFRTKPRIKQAIQRAAGLTGVDDSVFTMTAAFQAALATIAAHETTVLSPVDHAAFFTALDEPPEPTARLRAAFERHRQSVRDA
jgi:uncharacterized protein (DUF1778 family)